jgi:4-amino-4-deoxy-L-arabinose transferase-like glycosyltransferase
MAVFGDGNAAVRGLSAALSTATVVVLWSWARRRFGPTIGLLAAGLLATSPFAIRYAAEARMYALVMFEVVLGLWAVDRAWRQPSLGKLAAVTAAAALLLYTHYWGIYLVVAAIVTAFVASRRPGGPARRLAWALVAAFVLWLPWVPTFLFQSRHTGTPWAAPASVTAALQVFSPNLGGPTLVVAGFGVAMVVTFLIGAAAAWDPAVRSRPATVLALVAVGTLAIGVFGAIVNHSAVSTRYLAVAVPLVVLVAAVGVARLVMPWRVAAFLLIGTAGVVLAATDITTPRTTADNVVAEIAARAQPGDVVVYCPDQLAPAMHRLLTQRGLVLDEVVFPNGSTPSRVNWIDYGDRAADVYPLSMASAILRGGPTNVWLVVSLTYPPTQPACRGLLNAFVSSGRELQRLLADDGRRVEHGALWWFGPPGPVIVRQ